MKKLVVFILNIIALGTALAQGIQFEPENTPWTAILTQAQQENKLVFVAAYSQSCHNCQHMLEKAYPQEAVGAVFNRKYINIKMDVDSGEGINIADQYQIRAYPTYLFVNGKGELLHRAMGTMTPEKLTAIGQQASDPDHQFYVLKNRFDQGDRSGELLKNLTFMAKDLGDHDLLDTVHLAYLATQQDWLTKDNMAVILAGMKSIEQVTFAFLLQHKAAFIKEFGEVKINNQIDEVVLNCISMYAYDQVKGDFDLTKAKDYGARYLPPALLDQSMSLFMVNQLKRKHAAGFLAAAVRHFDQYPCYNGFLLNNIALAFYENTEDAALLNKALTWSLKAITLQDIYPFNDMAAALYFKLGDKEKAKAYAQKAIQQANESGSKVPETVSLLKRIESM